MRNELRDQPLPPCHHASGRVNSSLLQVSGSAERGVRRTVCSIRGLKTMSPPSFRLTANGALMRNVGVTLSASRHVFSRSGYGAATRVDHAAAGEQATHVHAEPTASGWQREAAMPLTPGSGRDPRGQGARRLWPRAIGTDERPAGGLGRNAGPVVGGRRPDARELAAHADALPSMAGPRPGRGNCGGAFWGRATDPPVSSRMPYSRHSRFTLR